MKKAEGVGSHLSNVMGKNDVVRNGEGYVLRCCTKDAAGVKRRLSKPVNNESLPGHTMTALK